MRTVALACVLLFWSSLAWAVNQNPVPGSVWTWLGPTYGADWTFPPGQVQTPQCKADGVTDNSGCVQTALNSLCAGGGGVLYLAAGRWKFHDVSITCNGVHIVGAGIGGPAGYTDAGQRAGTYVDCTGMAAYCIQFQPSPAPAINRLSGGSVEKMSFYNSLSDVGTVLRFRQVFAGYVRDVATWQAPNAVMIFAASHFNAFNVQTWGTTGNSWDVSGDNSGFTSINTPGQPCNGADCSTRTDYVVLLDIYGTQASTGTFVNIHEGVYTIVGRHMAMENGAYGLRVRCNPTEGAAGRCPSQISFDDLETEYAIHPFDLQDFTWFRCTNCYAVGVQGSGTNTFNDVTASLVNMAATGGGGGGVVIRDGQFSGANGACLDLAVTDVMVSGNDISGCGNNTGNYPAVHLSKGSQHRISDNSFCSTVNAAPYYMTGVQIDQPATMVTLTGNSYFNCVSPAVVDNTTGGIIHQVNEVPHPSVPSYSFSPTGLGSTGTATASSGTTDFAGTILLQPNGTGIAASGSITIPFQQKRTPQPMCSVTALNGGAAGWNQPATIVATSSAVNSYTFSWSNGGGSMPLVAGNGYYLQYICVSGG